ncbi:hypothetical protein DMUE_1245 [Dictyocoela muelleri]|nr:hypothetical protein DMUE_1245 [Dictyocoela muelleri]
MNATPTSPQNLKIVNSYSSLKKSLSSPTALSSMLKSYPSSIKILKPFIISTTSELVIDTLFQESTDIFKTNVLNLIIKNFQKFKNKEKLKLKIHETLKQNRNDFFSYALKLRFGEFDAEDLYKIFKTCINKIPKTYLLYVYDKVRDRTITETYRFNQNTCNGENTELNNNELKYLYLSYALLISKLKKADHKLVEIIVKKFKNPTVKDIPLLKLISSLFIDIVSAKKLFPVVKNLIQNCMDVLDQIVNFNQIFKNKKENKYIQKADIEILDTLLTLTFNCYLQLRNIAYPQLAAALMTNIPNKLKKIILKIISVSNDQLTTLELIYKIGKDEIDDELADGILYSIGVVLKKQQTNNNSCDNLYDDTNDNTYSNTINSFINNNTINSYINDNVINSYINDDNSINSYTNDDNLYNKLSLNPKLKNILNKTIKMNPEIFSKTLDILKNCDEFLEMVNENSKYVILNINRDNSIAEKIMKFFIKNKIRGDLDFSILKKISRIPSENFFPFLNAIDKNSFVNRNEINSANTMEVTKDFNINNNINNNNIYDNNFIEINNNTPLLPYCEEFLNQILMNQDEAFKYFKKNKKGLKNFISENKEWFNEFSKVCEIRINEIYNELDIYELQLKYDLSSDYWELLGKKIIIDKFFNKDDNNLDNDSNKKDRDHNNLDSNLDKNFYIKQLNYKINDENLQGFITYLKCKIVAGMNIDKELINLKEFKNDKVDNFYSFLSLSNDVKYQRNSQFSIFKTLLLESDCRLFLKFFQESDDYEKFILFLKICTKKCKCIETLGDNKNSNVGNKNSNVGNKKCNDDYKDYKDNYINYNHDYINYNYDYINYNDDYKNDDFNCNDCNCDYNSDMKLKTLLSEELIKSSNKKIIRMCLLGLLKCSNINDLIPLLNNIDLKDYENINDNNQFDDNLNANSYGANLNANPYVANSIENLNQKEIFKDDLKEGKLSFKDILILISIKNLINGCNNYVNFDKLKGGKSLYLNKLNELIKLKEMISGDEVNVV